MILNFDDNEIGALVAILDLALRSHGLQAKSAVDIILAKLETAKLAERPEAPPAIDENKI